LKVYAGLLPVLGHHQFVPDLDPVLQAPFIHDGILRDMTTVVKRTTQEVSSAVTVHIEWAGVAVEGVLFDHQGRRKTDEQRQPPSLLNGVSVADLPFRQNVCTTTCTLDSCTEFHCIVFYQ